MSYEYINDSAIALIQAFSHGMDKLKGVPEFEKKDIHMVYIEIFSEFEEDIESSAEMLMEMAEKKHYSDIDKALAVSTEDDLEKKWQIIGMQLPNVVIYP